MTDYSENHVKPINTLMDKLQLINVKVGTKYVYSYHCALIS